MIYKIRNLMHTLKFSGTIILETILYLTRPICVCVYTYNSVYICILLLLRNFSVCWWPFKRWLQISHNRKSKLNKMKPKSSVNYPFLVLTPQSWSQPSGHLIQTERSMTASFVFLMTSWTQSIYLSFTLWDLLGVPQQGTRKWSNPHLAEILFLWMCWALCFGLYRIKTMEPLPRQWVLNTSIMSSHKSAYKKPIDMSRSTEQYPISIVSMMLVQPYA